MREKSRQLFLSKNTATIIEKATLQTLLTVYVLQCNTQDMLDAVGRQEWRQLLFVSCFLHSVVQVGTP